MQWRVFIGHQFCFWIFGHGKNTTMLRLHCTEIWLKIRRGRSCNVITYLTLIFFFYSCTFYTNILKCLKNRCMWTNFRQKYCMYICNVFWDLIRFNLFNQFTGCLFVSYKYSSKYTFSQLLCISWERQSVFDFGQEYRAFDRESSSRTCFQRLTNTSHGQ